MVDVAVAISADAALPPDITEESLTALVAFVLTVEEIEGGWDLGIRFVDDAVMQAAHQEFMAIDTPTDIMTFPYEDDSDDFPDADGDDAARMGGDLLISAERARANAGDAGWSWSDELRFLVVHGVLHLLGWDDHDAEERDQMLARQRELLMEWGTSS